MHHCHHFSMFNQRRSISTLVIFGQPTKAIALLFGQKWLIFITFQCSININQFQLWSFLGKFHGYSLTFRPTIAHFHHFSLLNHTQSISMLVICGQTTKAIALLFAHKWLIVITFQCSIKINQFEFWSFLGKIPRL